MECPIPPVVLNPQLVYTSHSAVGCAGPKVEQDPALMLRVKYQVRLEATGVEKKRDIGQFLLAKFPPFRSPFLPQEWFIRRVRGYRCC
jgi:hypothetical protein